MKENNSKNVKLPPRDFTFPNKSVLLKETDEKLKSFTDLLENISTLQDKRKSLWKNIFENAITDRNLAYIAYVDLYLHVSTDPAAHAIHGTTLSKYLERMEKCTNQIIKVAELVNAAMEKEKPVSDEEEDEEASPNDMYAKIQSGKFQ